MQHLATLHTNTGVAAPVAHHLLLPIEGYNMFDSSDSIMDTSYLSENANKIFAQADFNY